MLVTICFLLANIFFGFVKEVNVYNFGTRRALHRAYEVREVRFIQLQTTEIQTIRGSTTIALIYLSCVRFYFKHYFS